MRVTFQETTKIVTGRAPSTNAYMDMYVIILHILKFYTHELPSYPIRRMAIVASNYNPNIIKVIFISYCFFIYMFFKLWRCVCVWGGVGGGVCGHCSVLNLCRELYHSVFSFNGWCLDLNTSAAGSDGSTC